MSGQLPQSVNFLNTEHNSFKMGILGKNICYVADGTGIAFEVCKILMTKNIAKLAILHNNQENPKAIAELQSINTQIEVTFWQFDITMEQAAMRKAFEPIVKQLGHIDVLVNGATICKERDVNFTISVNLTGLINTTAVVLPHMDRTKGGRGGLILNIASVTGLDPTPVFCVYSATKFGVIGFTRSLSDPIYYENTGVAVVAVCPGPTKTHVRHNLTAFLEYGQNHVEKLKSAPSQDTATCARNIVKAMETARNGQIWIADMGHLELVKPQQLWHMKASLVEYLNVQG